MDLCSAWEPCDEWKRLRDTWQRKPGTAIPSQSATLRPRSSIRCCVGPRLARSTRPEKIIWPRRLHEDDPFEPAVLVIACEGAAALHLQHETGEIIGRVNAFLGFSAIGRIRIVQKPVTPEAGRPRPTPRPLGEAEKARLAQTVGGIDDDGLRAALERLGATILGVRK